MINLLPPIEKSKLLLEEKRKMFIILWFLVLFFFLSFSLILTAIKFYISGQAETQEIVFESLKKEAKMAEARGIQKEIDLADAVLSDLKDFYKEKIYLYQVLEKISNIMPQGAYLNNLSIVYYFDKEGEAGFRVNLAGFSPNRKTLFDLKNNLEKETDFKEVYFPPINWVKSNDIDFSLNFKIIKKTAPKNGS